MLKNRFILIFFILISSFQIKAGCFGRLTAWFNNQYLAYEKTYCSINEYALNKNLLIKWKKYNDSINGKFILYLNDDNQETYIGQIDYLKKIKEKIYYIREIYIDPKYRNKGFGKLLLNFCCAKLNDLKIEIRASPVESWYSIDSKEFAQELKQLSQFYEKSGFVTEEVKNGHYVMRKGIN